MDLKNEEFQKFLSLANNIEDGNEKDNYQKYAELAKKYDAHGRMFLVSLFDLLNYYKKNNDIKNEIKICKIMLGIRPSYVQIRKRLKKLEGTLDLPKIPKERVKASKEKDYLQEFYNSFISLHKEDFDEESYFDEELHTTIKCISMKENAFNKIKPIHHDCIFTFLHKLEKADLNNDYCTFAKICEQYIANNTINISAYENLRKVYQKSRNRYAEKEIIEEGISAFERIQDKLYCITEYIATMFSNSEFAEEFYNKQRNGYYSINGITLYTNWHSAKNSWIKRLEFLNNKLK